MNLSHPTGSESDALTRSVLASAHRFGADYALDAAQTEVVTSALFVAAQQGQRAMQQGHFSAPPTPEAVERDQVLHRLIQDTTHDIQVTCRVAGEDFYHALYRRILAAFCEGAGEFHAHLGAV